MSILDYFKKDFNNNTTIDYSNNDTIFNNINIYTDGACINNGKKNAKAGIGIYISDDFTISEKLIGLPTNQRAELYAILKALLAIDILNYKNINIYTDSMYSINCITKWVKGWKKNGWKDSKKKDVKNKDLIDNIDKIYSKYNHIHFNHVEAHTNKTDIHSICNDKADKLARNSLI
tara:strand:- start:658 stop:1185 length:528 start_codon:yes stop_codon:yes gene_type:complete